MIRRILDRWRGEAGYLQLTRTAFPLILSTGSISILLFVDRMMLSWDSDESIAAALPAGILNWTLLCPFMGVALYTSTFVAQYTGAQRFERVGASIWQGLRIACIGGAAMPLLAPFADEIFAFIGHAPEIQTKEVTYFRILNFCSFFFLINSVMSCFYSGRGKSWPIVWINLYLVGLNAALDYALIFGHWGFPALGIAGAAYATGICALSVTAIYAYLLLRSKNDATFATRRARGFDRSLAKRMLRFGIPSGGHMFLDVLGMSIFMQLIGRMGTLELAASNIVHQIHLLGLLPLIGVGIATSVTVGRYQGASQPHLAERACYSALHMIFLYNAIVIAAFLFIPDLFISAFLAGRASEPPPELLALCLNLMNFVAGFIAFESVSIISSGALKGAGDTRFVLQTLIFTSIGLIIVPSYLVTEVFHLPLQYAWLCLTASVITISVIFFLRFRSGAWKGHRMIEGD